MPSGKVEGRSTIGPSFPSIAFAFAFTLKTRCDNCFPGPSDPCVVPSTIEARGTSFRGTVLSSSAASSSPRRAIRRAAFPKRGPGGRETHRRLRRRCRIRSIRRCRTVTVPGRIENVHIGNVIRRRIEFRPGFPRPTWRITVAFQQSHGGMRSDAVRVVQYLA